MSTAYAFMVSLYVYSKIFYSLFNLILRHFGIYIAPVGDHILGTSPYKTNLGFAHNRVKTGPPQGFWGSGEKGYLFSGSWGALLIILGELGSKHILLGI